MSTDKKLIELTKKLYEIINSVAEEIKSQKGRIKMYKDIILRLNKTNISPLNYSNYYGSIYQILKSIPKKVLKEDPYKPNEFIITITEWYKFYRDFQKNLSNSG